MRRLPFAMAAGIAVSLAGCGQAQPQAPTPGLQIASAGGPVGNGRFTITGGATATGPGRGKLQRFLAPPLRVICPPPLPQPNPN